ncbi:MAG: type II secretion system F family protein [Eubacterium sp.]|nr:type II secretion system F family protein [Eubacterium sp.]
MDYRSYKAGNAEKIMIMFALAVSLSAVGVLFYDTPLAVLAAPLVFLPAVKAYSYEMAGKRRNRLRNQFRDLLDSLASSFAGGRHLYEALEEARKELSTIYDGDDEILAEISGMLKKMDDGDTDTAVMSDFAARSGIEDIEVFARVFSVCRETGGDMITAMTDASGMLADKIKIENGIRALTSQKKTEGMVISVMPVVVILFLRAVAPDYIDVMYGSTTGICLMTLALAAAVYSYYLIRKITEIEV